MDALLFVMFIIHVYTNTWSYSWYLKAILPMFVSSKHAYNVQVYRSIQEYTEVYRSIQEYTVYIFPPQYTDRCIKLLSFS